MWTKKITGKEGPGWNDIDWCIGSLLWPIYVWFTLGNLLGYKLLWEKEDKLKNDKIQ